VVERVRDITGGALADVVIDAVPYNTETFVDAVDCVRRSGTVFISGRKGPTSKVKNLVVDKIVENGLRIQGAHGKATESYKQVAAMLESGRFPLEKLATGEHAICVSLVPA
jgi:threonine dehydrogenase-like Zn-dependent dehydrogenase